MKLDDTLRFFCPNEAIDGGQTLMKENLYFLVEDAESYRNCNATGEFYISEYARMSTSKTLQVLSASQYKGIIVMLHEVVMLT